MISSLAYMHRDSLIKHVCASQHWGTPGEASNWLGSSSPKLSTSSQDEVLGESEA